MKLVILFVAFGFAITGTLGACPCKDQKTNCQALEADGYCSAQDLSKIYCQDTCNLCSDVYGPSACPNKCPCHDSVQDCVAWKSSGKCGDPSRNIKPHPATGATCPKTCKVCNKYFPTKCAPGT